MKCKSDCEKITAQFLLDGITIIGEALCDIIKYQHITGKWCSTSRMEDVNHRTGTESEKFNQI
jgi:hypothetical protein